MKTKLDDGDVFDFSKTECGKEWFGWGKKYDGFDICVLINVPKNDIQEAIAMQMQSTTDSMTNFSNGYMGNFSESIEEHLCKSSKTTW